MIAITSCSHAHGDPVVAARIRSTPEDFVVEELLDLEFTGDGEHDWLWVEKTGANTHWVAGRLARYAGIPERDVGYAGLKDRHAVSRQWFSVRRAGEPDWTAFDAEGVRLLQVCRHRRKLKRGAHRGNRFTIVLRGDGLASEKEALDRRLSAIGASGVPNYFGEQRFGINESNLENARALFSGRRLPRHTRSLALSAARSMLFNAVLDARVRDGTWNRIIDGEVANLDGSGSIFLVEAADEQIQIRCAAGDIHPTATLWGRRAPLCRGQAATLEQHVAAEHSDIAVGLEASGAEAAARALRLPVRGLSWEVGDNGLTVAFSLDAGSFATAVLREIARLPDT